MPNRLTLNIVDGPTFDGKQTHRCTLSVDRETIAFRGDSFSMCYSHAMKMVERYATSGTFEEPHDEPGTSA